MYTNFEIKLLSNLSNNYHRNFVSRFHYKGSLPRGCKFNFCLYINKKLAGIASYGVPSSKNYNNGGYIELKRFTLSPNCVKNTASWFMAKCHKLLPKEYSTILSYAEADRHEGTIYKASNFTFMGSSKKGQTIVFKGKEYHLRVAYQKINGIPTKTSLLIRSNLKTGKAKYVSKGHKNIYMLKRK